MDDDVHSSCGRDPFGRKKESQVIAGPRVLKLVLLTFDQSAELLELRRAGRGAPFEHHGFGGGDDRSAGGQAAGDFPVEFGSVGNSGGRDEDLITGRQKVEHMDRSASRPKSGRRAFFLRGSFQ